MTRDDELELAEERRAHGELVWTRIAEVGRADGHAVGACSSCGELTSVAVEPLVSRGPRKGAERRPWPECRYCHDGRVIPSAEDLELVERRTRPTIPRAPAERDARVRLPWPGVDG